MTSSCDPNGQSVACGVTGGVQSLSDQRTQSKAKSSSLREDVRRNVHRSHVYGEDGSCGPIAVAARESRGGTLGVRAFEASSACTTRSASTSRLVESVFIREKSLRFARTTAIHTCAVEFTMVATFS